MTEEQWTQLRNIITLVDLTFDDVFFAIRDYQIKRVLETQVQHEQEKNQLSLPLFLEN